ncbi:hypothetical protein EJB05_02335, partial [Eragrostis curvula]
MANAALPGLLPTPAKSAMIPSLAACIPILPAKTPSKAMPGRADAVERWDAHKTKPGSASPSSSSSSSSPRSPASSSLGRASSCDRWDINKNKCPSSTSPSTSSHRRRESKWDSNKRPIRRSSAAERWDLHKKPRSLQQAIYAGPGFLTSPEPCMLPIPAFMVRAS